MVNKIQLRVSGMTCAHCEKRITEAVKKIVGVKDASASFPKKSVEVTYESGKVNEEAIKATIEEEGYRVVDNAKEHPVGKVVPVFIIVIALYLFVRYTIGFDFLNMIPRIDSTISLTALFVTGILTSVHCVSMCGGINLSQSVGTANSAQGKVAKPVLYNLGRVISYTVIGGIAGGLGSVLFVSQAVKGIIMLIAATFMILMSLSMLGWLPSWLVPRLPKSFGIKANQAKRGKGPLGVGLLNGLIPCGPLQAMQLYALSTGSVFMGALSMMLFSLGTVPLMLGVGLVFSSLKGKYTRVISRVSAVLVMLIAVVMLSNAGGLFGINLLAPIKVQAAETNVGKTAVVENSAISQYQQAGYSIATIDGDVQYVEGNLEYSGYPSIVVQKGVPVQFNIIADRQKITGCNETVEFSAYGVQKRLNDGDNIIEFTPEETGTVYYSCWMGMVFGTIEVVDSLEAKNDAASPELSSSNTPDEYGTDFGNGACALPQSTLTKQDVTIAKIEGNTQYVIINVDEAGYSPSVIVLQRGLTTSIKINVETLNDCNYYIDFGELGTLDLSSDETTLPDFIADEDITFTCGMGMLNGFVKVVDDITNVDEQQVVSETNEAIQNTDYGFADCCQ